MFFAKKIYIIVALLLPIYLLAQDYVAVGVGAGGEAEAANVTLEIGAMTQNKSLNYLYAVSVGFIFNGDSIPSDILEYPVPHTDYTSLGTKRKGTEIPLLLKYGLEVIKDKKIFVYVLGGASFGEEIELAQSNATGWYYEQSSTSKIYGMYGGGVSYKATDKLLFSVEYDNRRGATGSIGYFWSQQY